MRGRGCMLGDAQAVCMTSAAPAACSHSNSHACHAFFAGAPHADMTHQRGRMGSPRSAALRAARCLCSSRCFSWLACRWGAGAGAGKDEVWQLHLMVGLHDGCGPQGGMKCGSCIDAGALQPLLLMCGLQECSWSPPGLSARGYAKSHPARHVRGMLPSLPTAGRIACCCSTPGAPAQAWYTKRPAPPPHLVVLPQLQAVLVGAQPAVGGRHLVLQARGQLVQHDAAGGELGGRAGKWVCRECQARRTKAWMRRVHQAGRHRWSAGWMVEWCQGCKQLCREFVQPLCVLCSAIHPSPKGREVVARGLRRRWVLAPQQHLPGSRQSGEMWKLEACQAMQADEGHHSWDTSRASYRVASLPGLLTTILPALLPPALPSGSTSSHLLHLHRMSCPLQPPPHRAAVGHVCVQLVVPVAVQQRTLKAVVALLQEAAHLRCAGGQEKTGGE